MATIRIPSTMASPINCERKKSFSFRCEIFDPESTFIKYFDHLLLVICLLSVYVDSLFFYMPTVKDLASMTLDMKLGFFVAILRVIGDFFLFLGIIVRFRTALTCDDRDSRALLGKRMIVNESRVRAKNYLKSTFIIDLLASLPLPQAYIFYNILASKGYQAAEMYNHLTFIFEVQFVPRCLSTVLVGNKMEKTTWIGNPWSGTLYIFFVYGILSHFLGAFYYRAYIHELLICREVALLKQANGATGDLNQMVAECIQDFGSDKGLLSDVFANNIGSRSFTQKYMFCFSWGLKTLSSMGQNLNSSVLISETTFNLLVVIIGLVVFADLVARMQTCMQSVGEQEEQQMVRQRELEDWSNFHQLPPYLKKHLLQTVQYQLHSVRGIDDEAILDSLPMELCCEIRRHLYLELVRNLPIFDEMDDQLLYAVCGHLRRFTGVKDMFVVLEGDPIQQVLFIFSGQLETFSIDNGSSSSSTVGPGAVCGQELVVWSSLSSSSTHKLPSSTCTVKCLTDVEAFALRARDVKLLAIHFNYDQKLFDALSRRSL